MTIKPFHFLFISSERACEWNHIFWQLHHTYWLSKIRAKQERGQNIWRKGYYQYPAFFSFQNYFVSSKKELMLIKSSFITQQLKPSHLQFLKQSSLYPKRLLCLEDLKGTSVTRSLLAPYFTFLYEWDKRNHFWEPQLLLPPERAYCVPDNALWLRDPYPGMERGVCGAVGEVQKLLIQVAVAQSDVRTFKDVPLQQKWHHWLSSCWTPPHPALSSCKGQSLQKESEHSLGMDGYMHTS